MNRIFFWKFAQPDHTSVQGVSFLKEHPFPFFPWAEYINVLKPEIAIGILSIFLTFV